MTKNDKYRKSKAIRKQRLAAARLKGTHTQDEWNRMVSFFEGRCVRCGSNEYAVERDHIIPLYQDGSDSIRNIQPLCARCNAQKGPENIDHRGVNCPDEWKPLSELEA